MNDYTKALYIVELCQRMDAILKRVYEVDADFSTDNHDMGNSLAEIDSAIATVSAACQTYVDTIDNEGGPAKAQYNREMEDWNGDER